MRNILIVAFDGLQPAQVTPALMPHLAAFVAEGVAFDNHHPVYPSVTRINAASMVTGCNPGAHGIAANMLVMRDYDPHTAFSALEPTLANVARKTSVLLKPTLADILSRHGLEYVAVGSGTSGNSYLHNPNAERVGGATIHPEFCLPYSLHHDITARFGDWPPEGVTNADKLERAVDIATAYVLTERKPAVTFVWFSEPDKSQHAHGVGAEVSTRALREADEQFGRLLSWLNDNGPDTDVIVISDHGYSTISEVIDVERLLRSEGFPPGRRAGRHNSRPQRRLRPLLRGHDRDAATVDRLASYLMRQSMVRRASRLRRRRAYRRRAPCILSRRRRSARPRPRNVIPLGFACKCRQATRATPSPPGGAPELGQHGLHEPPRDAELPVLARRQLQERRPHRKPHRKYRPRAHRAVPAWH